MTDSLCIGPGQLAASNADQARKAAAIAKEAGRTIVAPGEVRRMLALKGQTAMAPAAGESISSRRY